MEQVINEVKLMEKIEECLNQGMNAADLKRWYPEAIDYIEAAEKLHKVLNMSVDTINERIAKYVDNTAIVFSTDNRMSRNMSRYDLVFFKVDGEVKRYTQLTPEQQVQANKIYPVTFEAWWNRNND